MTARPFADLASQTMEELTDFTLSAGEKAYRARQVYEWLHVHGSSGPEEMTNLPKTYRTALAEAFGVSFPETVTCQVSKLDGTRKYLFRFADGNMAESVRMEYHHGFTACVSSQVGCRMGCSFCASTIGGLTRNLTPGEILSQIYAMERDTGERISNVVIMGTGEPLDNYEAAVRFIRMLTDERGHNISERNVTLSTCGLVPGILRLAKEKLAINLALSLHAPNDALRRQLMPVANRYTLQEITDALKTYYNATHRRLTFEYALIRDVNDTDACAAELAALVRPFQCLINLIPVNPVRENAYRRTGAARVAAFQKKLENYGINVTIRREMGRDIDGACGQLRKRCSEMDE